MFKNGRIKKVCISFFILLIASIFGACGQQSEPFRGITYGMSKSQVQDIETQNGSRKVPDIESGLEYTTTLEGREVNIHYNFSEPLGLTSFQISLRRSTIGKSDSRFDDPEGFFADFMDSLNALYGEPEKTIRDDGTIYMWVTDYEIITGYIQETAFTSGSKSLGEITNAIYEFKLLNTNEESS